MTATIQVENLKTTFHTDDGLVTAVDGVSFSVQPGHTLGIVGESGSGKSVTSLSIMRLLTTSANIDSGRIALLGRDLLQLPEKSMRSVRGKDISMIFQEPMTSLNPVYTVGSQVAEAIILHQHVSHAEARRLTIELFREVGIPQPERRVDSYPHEMSGGQKQRVMIAMALSCNPQLLIADEPTTALDVTIQAQILQILARLRDERNMAILFITHDLGVIAEIADEVLVMYRGRMVEHGPVLEIFKDPQHPYTKGLLACRPRFDTPYRRLPTVSDFLEVRTTNGKTEIREKKLSDERLAELTNAGRPRLLHPQSELQAIGHPWNETPKAADTQAVAEGTRPLLEVQDLQVHFPVRKGLLNRTIDLVRAVDGVSFRIYKGQTLGLVGESGCGKTTTGRAILRLLEPTGGKVWLDGTEITQIGKRALQQLRSKMQVVFQDPYGSLNPRMTIESIVTEPMVIQRLHGNRQQRRDRAATLLEEVGLSGDHLRRYPHEFSGGQRQRICIARALAVEPELLVCDESVSALDVSVQAQVLNLLNDLQREHGLTYLFISHDLSVVKFMADMMAVMNAGKIVEFGPSEAIYAAPREEYTRKLIAATPNDDLEHIRAQIEQRASTRRLK